MGVEVHVTVGSMLPEEAQVLPGARPAQQAKGVLFIGSKDEIHAPHLALLRLKHAKKLVKPAMA